MEPPPFLESVKNKFIFFSVVIVFFFTFEVHYFGADK